MYEFLTAMPLLQRKFLALKQNTFELAIIHSYLVRLVSKSPHMSSETAGG